jgi:hypothetical protein
VLAPYVTANLRTLATGEQVVSDQSSVYSDGTYTIPTSVDIDGLSLTLSKIGLAKKTQRKLELLHFGYVAQWEYFRDVVISRHLCLHKDTSLSMQLFFHC